MQHLGPKHQFDRIMIVSGDRESEVRYRVEQVGIKEVYAEQRPEEKLAIVRRETARAKTLCVGDGINEAPAMMAATVGMAVGQNSDVTAEAADVVAMENSLKKVDKFMHLSRRMRSIALQSAVGRHGLEPRWDDFRRVGPFESGGRSDLPGNHRCAGRAQRAARRVSAESDFGSRRMNATGEYPVAATPKVFRYWSRSFVAE